MRSQIKASVAKDCREGGVGLLRCGAGAWHCEIKASASKGRADCQVESDLGVENVQHMLMVS